MQEIKMISFDIKDLFNFYVIIFDNEIFYFILFKSYENKYLNIKITFNIEYVY
jgi:hypothetical protein